MFLDTSGSMCLYDVKDRRQGSAISFYRNAHQRLTSSYVISEFIALAYARKAPRAGALSFVADIHDAGSVEIVWVDEALHRRAFALLLSRMDKNYSLCDAVSFILMRERGFTDALTTDKHFEQEGLVRLLTP